MINFNDARIALLAAHRVGNKQRGEANFVSEELISMDGVLEDTLFRFFTKSLKKSYDVQKFVHHSNLNLNEVYKYVVEIFNDPMHIYPQSINILHHLFEQSDHPNIKTGELYVAFFRDLLYEDEMLTGIGIFKTEKKSRFLQIQDHEQSLSIHAHEGVLAEKMDKGCLILNTEKNDGFRVFTYDNNSYDTQYWNQKFLGIDYLANDHFHTVHYMDMCNSFSEAVVGQDLDQHKKVEFLSRSLDYFSQNEHFDADDFAHQTLPSTQMKDQFKEWRTDYGLDNIEQFEISKPGVQKSKSKFKALIKLDTEIEIKLKMKNPEEEESFIERGYDKEKGMWFYKLYFNEEY